MAYEVAIYCDVCGSMRGMGGFMQSVQWNDTEVLANASHNPWCTVPANGGTVSQGQSDEADVTVYHIA